MAALIVCLTLTMSIAMVTAARSTVTFVFGDSLTDVGNNNFLRYSLAKSNYPWYGVDYINGQATGRFTNGRTIGDIISAKLGIQSPPPYLSLSMDDDAILHGINYASGGAGILNETGVYFVQKLSFDDQITCFEKTKAAITLKIGEKASEKLCNEAVYFIGFGSNDYVNNFMQPFLVDAQLYTHNEFLELLVITLNGQLRVVFHGLGPLGCIPSQRVRSGTGECLEQANQYALEFNSRVKKLLVALNAKLPGAQMALADSYDIVLDLINNPERYGFKISKTSCCNVDTTVGGLCLPNSRLCSNRSEYVFWDAYHPTDAANAVIAELLFADPDMRQAPAPVSELAPAPSPL
ncbi:GDSL esterase/lipase [Cocos nucifera]|uniref:GDSL esterase/lipase n=1 Tax=Cocos nucifera TaxID=13894 RepID=A0A8K0I2F2_COCNU|nr:GDSL esterase/lipase [Cocos nucifera]